MANHLIKSFFTELRISPNSINSEDKLIRWGRNNIVTKLISRGRLPVSMSERKEYDLYRHEYRYIITCESVYLGRVSIYKYSWADLVRVNGEFNKQPLTYPKPKEYQGA